MEELDLATLSQKQWVFVVDAWLSLAHLSFGLSINERRWDWIFCSAVCSAGTKRRCPGWYRWTHQYTIAVCVVCYSSYSALTVTRAADLDTLRSKLHTSCIEVETLVPLLDGV